MSQQTSHKQPHSNGVSGAAIPTEPFAVGDKVEVVSGAGEGASGEVIGLVFDTVSSVPYAYTVRIDNEIQSQCQFYRDQLALAQKTNLVSEFASFVERKKPMEPKKTSCEHCNQPIPTDTPYRSSGAKLDLDPEPPTKDVYGWIDDFQAKASFGLAWLRANTPKPIAWMFKSLGWVAVGGVVAAVAIGVGYFLLRYLVWYALVAIGKWILDRIRDILPIGMAMPLSNTGNEGEQWGFGVLVVVGVVGLAYLGKLVGWYWGRYRIKRSIPSGSKVMVKGKGEATVVFPHDLDNETLVQADWCLSPGTMVSYARKAAKKLGMNPDNGKFSWVKTSQIKPLIRLYVAKITEGSVR